MFKKSKDGALACRKFGIIFLKCLLLLKSTSGKMDTSFNSTGRCNHCAKYAFNIVDREVDKCRYIDMPSSVLREN